MAYVTGSANDMAALRSAFIAACTANGWTLTGDVLHKGNVFVKIQVVSGFLALNGVTAADGSGDQGTVVRIGRVSTGIPDLVWPVTYEVFISTVPDEVYLIVNYDVDKYQYACFGQSVIADLPGLGAWYSASLSYENPGVTQPIAIDSNGYDNIAGRRTMAPFWRRYDHTHTFNSAIHHGLDGVNWSTVSQIINAAQAISELTNALPNAWNSEAVLLPIQPWIPRASNKVSMVADFKHARYLRVDNHTPGDVITIGSDRWKAYPFYRKNTVVRNGGAGIDHTGTFGWAIRYDGP